ncbi:hypothetical protein BC833DRAFT_624463 [Globomyces pollinis-pini]|nr:hypothetical protein BC833DRAFT_624463 [Globomyces pollinis-pini]
MNTYKSLQRQMSTRAYSWKHFPETPYQVLRVSNSENLKTLKSQYYLLSKEYHPDKTTRLSDNQKKQRTEHYLKIQDAYYLLKDPNSRKSFDEQFQSHGEPQCQTQNGYPKTNHHHTRSHTYAGGPTFNWESFELLVLTAVFGTVVSYMASSNDKEAQKREIQIGWDLHNHFRRKEGLNSILNGTKTVL